MAGLYDGGSFLIAYLVANLMWAIPLMLTEIGIGKRMRMGTIGSFRDFVGKKYAWLGAWCAFVCAAITFYYAVVFSWALRYFFMAVIGTIKPGLNSQALWDGIINDPLQGILWNFIAAAIAGIIIYKGVQGGLEKTNKIMIPALFISLIATAIWGLSKPGATLGLKYLFVPNWAALASPAVWLNAFAQASWSTGAGWGETLTCAVYTKENEDVVANTHMIVFGDMLGAMCGALAVLPLVFAFSPSEAAAIETLKSGNYGLTFIYLTKFFAEAPGGALIASLFFLALSFAALSSLLPQTEVIVRNYIDAGYDRKKATLLVSIAVFILGMPSAASIKFLNNQDWVWGVALLVSGVMFAFAVCKYGVDRVRTELINPDSDIMIGKSYNIRIMLFPVLFTVLFGWWIWQSKTWHPTDWWNPFLEDSVGTIIFQFAIVGLALYLMNDKLAKWVKSGSVPGETIR
ncbi:NSS family neurotransmitter:Na+ symporter [Thermosediminibacter litoriperuensis]|uniref:NSS family neurotransmitter:Na+ symporter n=2 Tax=Thermosediminibacter litoriperuensis TaxID=291989 RepID=A0A5S5ASN0_9FIRM|nr:NSS family neurotransmitter:Na+ symporter [Thermosediminibacter litoriperuensis]